MRTDTVKVICRSKDCGAQYEARVGVDTLGRDVRHLEVLYNATLPTCCGVCGFRGINLRDADARPVRV